MWFIPYRDIFELFCNHHSCMYQDILWSADGMSNFEFSYGKWPRQETCVYDCPHTSLINFCTPLQIGAASRISALDKRVSYARLGFAQHRIISENMVGYVVGWQCQPKIVGQLHWHTMPLNSALIKVCACKTVWCKILQNRLNHKKETITPKLISSLVLVPFWFPIIRH